ncbi:MAG: hypothetical protein AB8B55_16370, partial [Mariniblastus sp.]
HAHNATVGYGHVYQGRYKSFPVQDDDHFHTVCRYVERNALTANVVKRAEGYRWGSLWNWQGADSVSRLSPWPVRRLPRWVERVNQSLTKKETEAVQNCIKRGSPFGAQEWVQNTAKKLGLELTLRPRVGPKNCLK